MIKHTNDANRLFGIIALAVWLCFAVWLLALHERGTTPLDLTFRLAWAWIEVNVYAFVFSWLAWIASPFSDEPKPSGGSDGIARLYRKLVYHLRGGAQVLIYGFPYPWRDNVATFIRAALLQMPDAVAIALSEARRTSR